MLILCINEMNIIVLWLNQYILIIKPPFQNRNSHYFSISTPSCSAHPFPITPLPFVERLQKQKKRSPPCLSYGPCLPQARPRQGRKVFPPLPSLALGGGGAGSQAGRQDALLSTERGGGMERGVVERSRYSAGVGATPLLQEGSKEGQENASEAAQLALTQEGQAARGKVKQRSPDLSTFPLLHYAPLVDLRAPDPPASRRRQHNGGGWSLVEGRANARLSR